MLKNCKMPTKFSMHDVRVTLQDNEAQRIGITQSCSNVAAALE